MSEPDMAISVLNNKTSFRCQSAFKNWPLDERRSVCIETISHTGDEYDEYEYVRSDRPYALHIGSMLKHTLPTYSWVAGDESLRSDLRLHLEFFHMPVWCHVMEKLAHSNEYDNLQVAMEQLMAHYVSFPRILDWMVYRLHGFLKSAMFHPSPIKLPWIVWSTDW